MSGSIKESFERAFKDKNTVNKKAEKYESDDDSGKEHEKQVEMKRAKKRKRTTRKPNKAKKSVSQFKVRTAPTKERVTSDKYPEILSVDKEFSSNHQQTELIDMQ